MNELIFRAVLEVILGLAYAALMNFFCLRFSKPPLARDGCTIYSANRFMKYILVLAGIGLCSMLFGCALLFVLRDGFLHWGTAFSTFLTLVFAFVFMKGVQELCISYEICGNCLNVKKGSKTKTFEFSNLEVMGDTTAGLLLRDPWSGDFLISNYLDGYVSLRQQILDHVRDNR
jgi:hypothetical protein